MPGCVARFSCGAARFAGIVLNDQWQSDLLSVAIDFHLADNIQLSQWPSLTACETQSILLQPDECHLDCTDEYITEWLAHSRLRFLACRSVPQ